APASPSGRGPFIRRGYGSRGGEEGSRGHPTDVGLFRDRDWTDRWGTPIPRFGRRDRHWCGVGRYLDPPVDGRIWVADHLPGRRIHGWATALHEPSGGLRHERRSFLAEGAPPGRSAVRLLAWTGHGRPDRVPPEGRERRTRPRTAPAHGGARGDIHGGDWTVERSGHRRIERGVALPDEAVIPVVNGGDSLRLSDYLRHVAPSR